MPATTGLSFYLSESIATATQSLTYGFEVLSVDDLKVVGVHSVTNAKVTLVKDTDFTVNLETQTVTCTSSSWGQLTKISQLGDSGAKIRIYRTTSVVPLIDFKAGAVLSESDLDNAYKQGLFAAQEAVEDAADTSAGVQSVTEATIEDGAVTTQKIAAGAVDAVRLSTNSIDTNKLLDNAVVEAKIANNAVANLKIQNDAVTTEKILDNAVTTAKIADDNITQAKVAKATKANMEGQSSTDGVVTPDVLKYSPFAPRCYGTVAYNAGSAAVSTGSYNVDTTATAAETTANLSRKIYFDTDMGDTNYVVFGSVGDSTPSAGNDGAIAVKEKNTAYFVVETGEPENAGRFIDFVVFGSTLSA